jgi:outer membrane protein assembly factor BamB
VQDLAVGNGAIWVTNRRGAQLTRISIATDARAKVRTGAGPGGVTVYDDEVYVANRDDGTVWRYAARGVPRQDRVIDAGDQPVYVAGGSGAIWISDFLGNRLLRVDPRTGATVATRTGVVNPQRLLVAGRSVWVASANAGRVSRVRF